MMKIGLILTALVLVGCATSRFEACNGMWDAYERQVCEGQHLYIAGHADIDDSTRQAILGGKVRLGMTSEQVRASWGPPWRVNRYHAGRREQWVYGYCRAVLCIGERDPDFMATNYIYLDNGIVVDWQEF